jgi:hypothetical protein
MVRIDRRLVSFACACLAGLMPLTAAADPCKNWAMPSGWVAIQSNNYRTTFHLQHYKDGVVSGTGEVRDKDDVKRAEGPVIGTLKGNAMNVRAHWGGVYVGTVDATGRIDGTTYDKNDSTSSTTWYSDRRLDCSMFPSEAAAPSAAQPPSQPLRPMTRPRPQEATAPPAAPPPPLRPMSHPHATATGQPCASGYVWRIATPSDFVCVTTQSRDTVAGENAQAASYRQPGGDTCLSGYVWREAFDGDHVCVPPGRRDAVRAENQAAAQHVAQ